MFNPIVSDILIIFLLAMLVAVACLLFIAFLRIRAINKNVESTKNRIYTLGVAIDVLQNNMNTIQRSSNTTSPVTSTKKSTPVPASKPTAVNKVPQSELFAQIMLKSYSDENVELPAGIPVVNVEVNNGNVITIDARKPAVFKPLDNGNTKYIVVNNKYLFLNHVKYSGEYFVAYTSISHAENCYDVRSSINNVSVPINNQPIERIMPAEVTKEKDGTYTLKKKGVIYVK